MFLVAAGQKSAPDLGFAITAPCLDDQSRCIGFGAVRYDVGIGCHQISIADDEAGAAQDKLGAAGLLVGADNDDRGLDAFDGIGHLGERWRSKEKDKRREPAHYRCDGDAHINLREVILGISGEGLVMLGSNG